MTHKVTREHYDKWEDFAKKRGIAIRDLTSFNLKGKWDLEERYKKDPSLNNIPLSLFDNLWKLYRTSHSPKTWALYEGASVYKHLLIYKVLGVTPEFIGE